MPTLQRMAVPEDRATGRGGGGGPEERAGPSVFLQTPAVGASWGSRLACFLPHHTSNLAILWTFISFGLVISSFNRHEAGWGAPPLPLEQPSDSAAVSGCPGAWAGECDWGVLPPFGARGLPREHVRAVFFQGA